jgi:hypothetical protein
MIRLKFVSLVLVAGIIFTSACSPNNLNASPAQTVAVQSTVEYVNPYPIPEAIIASGNSENQVTPNEGSKPYPPPEDHNNLPIVLTYPEKFTTGLDIPSPSTGMAVITGQLMSAGENEKPYISVIYLAPVEPSNVPNQPATINFSRKTNLTAVQDIDNGRFVFASVNPGQYAIVIWSPGGSFFLKDSSGNSLLIEGKAGEVNDLGVIFFE